MIWKGYCDNTARYHRNKYKHWAKIVSEITNTHDNAYAFKGTWLNYHSENTVAESDFILEFDCQHQYRFYRADDRDNAVIGERDSFISFRDECIKYMTKFGSELYNPFKQFTDEEIISEARKRGLIKNE